MLVLVVSPAAESVAARGASMADSCPPYSARLRSARAYLERGDRAGAIAALREAREALKACMREEATKGSLLAAHGRRTPAG